MEMSTLLKFFSTDRVFKPREGYGSFHICAAEMGRGINCGDPRDCRAKRANGEPPEEYDGDRP